MISTHSGHLDRWMGPQAVAQLTRAMIGSYFDPIPVAMGAGLKVCNDGDFIGKLPGGHEACYQQWAHDRTQADIRAKRVRVARSRRQLGAITSFSSLLGAIGAGKRQDIMLGKTGVTGVANIANTLWDVGAQPAAGGTSAAAAGSSPNNTTVGGFLYDDATGGDSMYFIGSTVVPTVGNNLLLLYDRFFQVNHNVATDPQTVSGTPSRYQSTAARNTFLTVAVTTALGAGTPTYLVNYVDSEGNTAENTATQTMAASAIARRFPFAATVGNGWFFPLNSGDRGLRSIANLDMSAANTGNVDVVLGKPIAWIPCPVANMPVKFDATLSPADFVPMTASACLALMEINKGATTATSYSGVVTLCSG